MFKAIKSQSSICLIGIISILLSTMSIAQVQAQIKLATVFSDDMVIQRDLPINIWGTASVNAKIKILFKGKTYHGQADNEGSWLIILPPQPANTNQSFKVLGINTIVVNNIAFGDVFLAGGQSNMEFKLKEVFSKFPEEAKLEQYPDIRQLKVTRKFHFKAPLTNVAGSKWQSANTETVGNFSAVAWFFSKDLYQRFHVPIGIISSNVGATPIESWMSIESLKFFPKAQSLAYKLADAKYIEQLKKEYAQQRSDWHNDNNSENKALKKKKLPFMLMHRTTLDFKPVGLYNAMIAPLANTRFAGVIWYQGESNSRDPVKYAEKFTTMINLWRGLFEQPKLPFLFVQLANFKMPDKQPSESTWAILRDKQTQVLKTVQNTAMALAIDIGERHNIHPLDKKTVGERLALGARHFIYGEEQLNYISPLVDKALLSNGRAMISFKHINNGLLVKGDQLHGFAIAGVDKKYIWAKAILANNQVTVWHDSIKSPKHVRYAWANNPEKANLYNDQALPVTPFSIEIQ